MVWFFQIRVIDLRHLNRRKEKMKDIKIIIIDRIIEEVEAQIQNAERGRLTAIEDSKAHKGKMESRFDTFKEEAQNLAGALSLQVLELMKTLSALKSVRGYSLPITTVSGYAIVTVENCDDGTIAKYFLLPAGGGNEYDVGEDKVTVLSVGAPIARAFMGASVGDVREVTLQKKVKRFRIVSVS